MKHQVLTHVRRRLIGGLLLVLPLLITVWLLTILFNLIDHNVTPWVWSALRRAGFPGLEQLLAQLGVPLIGVVLTIVFIYLLGLIAANIAGRRVVALIESIILRIPLVKGVYGSARQLLDAFTVSGARAFSRVVLVEYPRHGVWTVGFVTAEVEHRIEWGTNGPIGSVPVFLPTTPNPTSGWMALVPTADLKVLEMSIEDGIKLIVSGGIVSPPDIGKGMRDWSPYDPGRDRPA